MDGGSFDIWLGTIPLLTACQRQERFMCLALAEADDEAALVAADASPMAVDEASGAADGKLVEAPVTVESDEPQVPVSASAAAQSRVESTGCPHCTSRRLHRWGHASDLPRYRCRDCGRTFNGLTSTPLAHLRKKDRWEAQAEALITGESVAKAAQRCGVAGSTAFRRRHRFLAAAAFDQPARLNAIVEADETFILDRSRANGPICRVPPASAAARRPSAACQPSRSPSLSPAIAAEPRPTRFSPSSTGPRSPSLCRALSHRTINCAAMAARRLSVSPASGTFLARSCPRPVGRGRRHPICTSTTSTAITAVSRNGCVPSTALRPNISTFTSDGDEPSKHGGMVPSQPIGCSAQSASYSANNYRE